MNQAAFSTFVYWWIQIGDVEEWISALWVLGLLHTTWLFGLWAWFPPHSSVPGGVAKMGRVSTEYLSTWSSVCGVNMIILSYISNIRLCCLRHNTCNRGLESHYTTYMLYMLFTFYYTIDTWKKEAEMFCLLLAKQEVGSFYCAEPNWLSKSCRTVHAGSLSGKIFNPSVTYSRAKDLQKPGRFWSAPAVLCVNFYYSANVYI